MDFFFHGMRLVARGVFAALEALPPIVSLALFSGLAGLGMLWVFGRVSNQAAIGRAKKRLAAHLYELRLFADEPRLIWRAQVGLLAWNVRYLGLMLVPALVLTAPLAVVLAHLEAFYGLSPLPIRRDAIVAVQMSAPLDLSRPVPKLEAPAGIRIETPAVRVPAEGQLCWRIRPETAASGVLRLVFPGATYEKSVCSGEGRRYISSRRVSGLLDAFLYPAEPRLEGGSVDWIEIRYPSATVALFGWHSHWLIWFLLISMATAWLLRKRFGVVL